MDQEELFGLMFVVTMAAGVGVIFMALRQQAQSREFQHRERMAMIERGQVPLAQRSAAIAEGAASSRSMSLGIVVVGLGLALMTLIGVAADSPSTGIGVGGAIAIVGGAFIVRSLIVKSSVPPAPPSLPAPPSDQGPSPLG